MNKILDFPERPAANSEPLATSMPALAGSVDMFLAAQMYGQEMERTAARARDNRMDLDPFWVMVPR